MILSWGEMMHKEMKKCHVNDNDDVYNKFCILNNIDNIIQ